MPNKLIVVVTGGRDYDTDAAREHVYNKLDFLNPGFVMHGACRKQGSTVICGADRMADDWAARRDIECYCIPAQWQKDGRAAGPKRNGKMLSTAFDMAEYLAGEGPYWDIQVVAFPGGSGTADCVRQARQNGIEVIDER